MNCVASSRQSSAGVALGCAKHCKKLTRQKSRGNACRSIRAAAGPTADRAGMDCANFITPWSMTWMKHQQPLRPQWQERATGAEIEEVEAIDKLIANLRSRRESIINRTKMRTQVWVAKRSEQKGQGSQSAA